MSGAAHGGGPRGQHFLRPDLAHRIVDAAGVGPHDLVLDLGAGTGALTLLLARRAERVVAVERDAKLARQLTRRAPDNVSVHVYDLRDLRLPHRPFRVVANLPFAGANEVVRRLLRAEHLQSADVIVELGAARGWTARSTRCSISRRVPASSFLPAPRCDAAVLRIR